MAGIIIFSFVLLIAITIYYYSLSRKYYLEKSLYQFRESKHQLVMYLGEHASTLDKDNYTKLKDLLHLINNTINHFTNVNSLRLSVKVVVLNTIHSDRQLEAKRKENEITEPFVKLYHQGIGYSLEAVPLLKIRVIISFVKFILSVLISFGYNRFKTKLSKIDSFLKAEDNYNNNQCFN